MTEQLIEMGRRIASLRDIVGLTAAELAEQCGVDADTLAAYERGERDFSFSFLNNAADVLGVDVVDLLTGDTPHLSICSLTRAGQGFAVTRRAAYDYSYLGATFRGKLADPFIVTVEPCDAKPELHAHDGQELNYMTEGRMRFYIGDIVHELAVGDSIYFNANVPHAMQALDGQRAQFLAVVVKPRGEQ